MMQDEFRPEAAAACEIALAAGLIQLDSLDRLVGIEYKGDRSPVSEIDRRCEETIIAALRRKFPDDGFLGEETGAEEGRSGRRWIIDPLDGTRPYLRGVPTFSVLIALEAQGQPVAGVIHLPALGRTYSAARGGGAFLDGAAIRVSGIDRPAIAMGSALGYRELHDTPRGRKLFELIRRWDYAYGFMDAFTYGLVASGRLDCSVNLLDKPWDCAAAAIIVAEAGGTYSDVTGVKTIHGEGFVMSNGRFHDELIEALRIPD
jgi:histidinol-phosphatase